MITPENIARYHPALSVQFNRVLGSFTTCRLGTVKDTIQSDNLSNDNETNVADLSEYSKTKSDQSITKFGGMHPPVRRKNPMACPDTTLIHSLATHSVPTTSDLATTPSTVPHSSGLPNSTFPNVTSTKTMDDQTMRIRDVITEPSQNSVEDIQWFSTLTNDWTCHVCDAIMIAGTLTRIVASHLFNHFVPPNFTAHVKCPECLLVLTSSGKGNEIIKFDEHEISCPGCSSESGKRRIANNGNLRMQSVLSNLIKCLNGRNSSHNDCRICSGFDHHLGLRVPSSELNRFPACDDTTRTLSETHTSKRPMTPSLEQEYHQPLKEQIAFNVSSPVLLKALLDPPNKLLSSNPSVDVLADIWVCSACGDILEMANTNATLTKALHIVNHFIGTNPDSKKCLSCPLYFFPKTIQAHKERCIKSETLLLPEIECLVGHGGDVYGRLVDFVKMDYEVEHRKYHCHLCRQRVNILLHLVQHCRTHLIPSKKCKSVKCSQCGFIFRDRKLTEERSPWKVHRGNCTIRPLDVQAFLGQLDELKSRAVLDHEVTEEQNPWAKHRAWMRDIKSNTLIIRNINIQKRHDESSDDEI